MPDPTSADPGEIRVPDVVFWTLSNPGHSSDGQARVSAPRAQWERLIADNAALRKNWLEHVEAHAAAARKAAADEAGHA